MRFAMIAALSVASLLQHRGDRPAPSWLQSVPCRHETPAPGRQGECRGGRARGPHGRH